MTHASQRAPLLRADGVKHDQVSELTKSRLGIKAQMSSADVNHIKTISGTMIMKRESRSLTMYDLSVGCNHTDNPR